VNHNHGIARLVLLAVCAAGVCSKSRAMLEGAFLYFPSHSVGQSNLPEWTVDGRPIGFSRTVADPKTIWLIFHGNAGQASQRGYLVDCLPGTDSVYVMEYPGYGIREGTPSMKSINAAAVEAYAVLRRTYPGLRIGVLSESLGSGPASYLCSLPNPPSRAVLIVPFDTLLSVAKEQIWFLPVSLLLRDKWDNVACLSKYPGRVDIYGAAQDRVIPVAHARNLAKSLRGAAYHEVPCGHNEWADLVRIED
jgi:hypothetical protein